MPVVSAASTHLDRAAELLLHGGVVAFPTETVYGLGAHAFDARAVARIFEIKRRPSFDPLIVHVLDEAMLGRVTGGVSRAARILIERFWPGPLTIVLPKRDDVPGIVTSGLSSVAVRMPAHPVARALLERCGVPLAAPSANPFGYLSPTRASHVDRMLGDAVDLIIDGGACEYGLESTIVSLGERPVLLRPGAITGEEIEASIGPLARGVDDATAPLAPGRLAHHYAPRTPLRLVPADGAPVAERGAAAFLGLRQAPAGYERVVLLSQAGDLREASARFFESLHELDESGVTRIDVETLPERGLGVALMDRVRRAASV